MKEGRMAKELRGLWFYIKAHIVRHHYDAAFLSGRHFKGRFHGLHAKGWSWIALDYRECRRNQINVDVPWPVSALNRVQHPENIIFHPDDLKNFQGQGKYFQAFGKIEIGKGTMVANGVSIITANHLLSDFDKHEEGRDVRIGEKCWLGINSTILPGVTLGDHVIVGAGAVVTKSFEDGYCILVGNPARVIRKISEEEVSDTLKGMMEE